MNGYATGLENPIMSKKEMNNSGYIVGSNKMEHFSNDGQYQDERNLTSFPKDQLTADELLPQDNSSLWAQVNPSGVGSLKDRSSTFSKTFSTSCKLNRSKSCISFLWIKYS